MSQKCHSLCHSKIVLDKKVIKMQQNWQINNKSTIELKTVQWCFYKANRKDSKLS